MIAEFPVEAPVTQFKQQVTLAFKPFGKRIYLECADVHDYASLRVNGKEVGARAWQPYRWDVTDVLIAGVNQIEIEVRTLPAGGRGFPSGGAALQQVECFSVTNSRKSNRIWAQHGCCVGTWPAARTEAPTPTQCRGL